MNRRKLPGVATASKRLADGTRRKYYYAWRGGPMLKGEDGAKAQEAPPGRRSAMPPSSAIKVSKSVSPR